MAGLRVMTGAMYASIWAALALFVLGELGKRVRHRRPDAARWLRRASGVGALLAAVHIVLALAIPQDWSHAIAWATTAARTREVFGFGSGLGLVANYLFVAVWVTDVTRWQTERLPFRVFAFVMIVSATFIFVSGQRRFMGMALSFLLLWIWRPQRPTPVF